MKMSTRDFFWDKGGRYVQLTTYHPCSAESQEIRDLNLPGTPTATSACRWTPLLYITLLQFSMSATTTQLLSSAEFCKLHYDTIPVKSASANVSFYTNNSKMPNFEL